MPNKGHWATTGQPLPCSGIELLIEVKSWGQRWTKGTDAQHSDGGDKYGAQARGANSCGLHYHRQENSDQWWLFNSGADMCVTSPAELQASKGDRQTWPEVFEYKRSMTTVHSRRTKDLMKSRTSVKSGAHTMIHVSIPPLCKWICEGSHQVSQNHGHEDMCREIDRSAMLTSGRQCITPTKVLHHSHKGRLQPGPKSLVDP